MTGSVYQHKKQVQASIEALTFICTGLFCAFFFLPGLTFYLGSSKQEKSLINLPWSHKGTAPCAGIVIHEPKTSACSLFVFCTCTLEEEETAPQKLAFASNICATLCKQNNRLQCKTVFPPFALKVCGLAAAPLLTYLPHP